MRSNKQASRMLRTNYYDFYQQAYAASFMTIDVLLKSMENPLPAAEAAQVLHMTEENVKNIMSQENIALLDKDGLLALMRLGTSSLCRMFQRELLYGAKPVYGPGDIARIYGLDEGHVREISAKMGHSEWPSADVPELLKQIPVFIVY